MSSEGTGAARQGRLVVLSGPSGSGKSSLWRRLVTHPQIRFSVSATTRPARPGERDGKDYRFLDAAEFERRRAAGEFLECAQVHGRWYGTLRADVEADLAAGKDVLLEIDVQGAAQVRDSRLPSVSIFVMPPSREELERRLRGRRSESEDEIARRLSIAAAEMAHAGEYDRVVVNEDLDTATAEIEAFLGLGKRA
ncbi:MAG TPA: guanylate kinase [Planctomycetota bacterium]